MEGCGGLQCHGKSVPGLNISYTSLYLLVHFSSVVPTLNLYPHLRMWVRCWPPVFTAAGSIRAAIFLLNDALPKAGNHISDVRDVTNSIHAWVCVARRPRSCVGGVRDAPHYTRLVFFLDCVVYIICVLVICNHTYLCLHLQAHPPSESRSRNVSLLSL